MLLRHSLGWTREADAVDGAVFDVIAAGARTSDMVQRSSERGAAISTRTMGVRVCERIA
jgi:hypothetical protein